MRNEKADTQLPLRTLAIWVPSVSPVDCGGSRSAGHTQERRQLRLPSARLKREQDMWPSARPPGQPPARPAHATAGRTGKGARHT